MRARNLEETAMRTVSLLVFLVLLSSPLQAADKIDRGVDLWRTLGNGTTYIDFSANPIPAGFFCESSPAFTGKVIFEGVPLETDVPGALYGADTVIERLDDATFNRRGVAVSRIQVRALSLASVKPIATGCGLWSILISLEGEQPTTQMRLVKTGTDEGFFKAPLALTAKLTFVPMVGVGHREPVTLTRSVDFAVTPKIPWSAGPRGGIEHETEMVRVDTDGDREPDRYVNGGSSFLAGVSGKSAAVSRVTSEGSERPIDTEPCYVQQCHCDFTRQFTGGGDYVSGSGRCAHLHCPTNAVACPLPDSNS